MRILLFFGYVPNNTLCININRASPPNTLISLVRPEVPLFVLGEYTFLPNTFVSQWYPDTARQSSSFSMHSSVKVILFSIKKTLSQRHYNGLIVSKKAFPCSLIHVNSIQWNPDLRTLLGPTQSVLISEVSSSQGFLVKVLDIC